MRKALLSFLCLALCSVMNPVNSQVVINEGSNRNYSAFPDENGNFPDWIELYNAGTDTVDLFNYSLTDDSTMPTRWLFPNIQLLPGDYLPVFCSGKNRAPIAPFVSVLSESNFTPVVGWNTHTLTTPLYWDGVSSLLINMCSYYPNYTTNSVFNQTATPYYATVVAAQDGSNYICSAETGSRVMMRPNLKLNNFIIGTGTVQNSPYDYPAPYGNWYWAAKNQMVIPAAELQASGLTAGYITTLAFDVAATDPATVYQYIDFSMKPVAYSEVTNTFEAADTVLRLHTNFKISSTGETVYLYDNSQTLLSSLLIDCAQPDVAIGLYPDANVAGNPVLFANGSPDSTNNLSQPFTSYLLPPVIYAPSGYYSSPVSVTMGNANGPATTIRYTLDGSDPSPTSTAYTGAPVMVFFSSVLKARVFSSTELPSPLTAATYFFGVSHVTPVLSVVTDPDNLYGATGIFDNWQFDWERAAYVEYFDTAHQLIFSQNAGMQVDGGWGGSRYHPQHSFRVELDHSVLGEGPVYYPLIPNRPERMKYSKIYLRNGSNYYLILPYKDAAHVEGMSAETYNYYSAWRPVSVYINGAYFGLYELREKLDAEFFEEADGADPDSLDLLSLSAWNNYVLRAVEGSVDSFVVDYLAFNNLNPALSGYWDAADEYFDLQYYTDYIVGETWAGNIDWPQNNIKIYRSNATGFRWRFCIIDLEGSMDPLGFSTAYDDHIAYVLGADPNNPFINVFLKSIQNPRYRNYFINRYADLMNTSYLYSRLSAVANSMFDQTVVEMPNEFMRWGDPANISGQMSDFINYHQTFLHELNIRTGQVRDDIENNFALNGQVNVTLDVFPPGAGQIKISTITPGPLPWTGVYFDGNPVQLTAIPNPGYQFEYWDANAVLSSIDTNVTIDLNIDASTLFRAVFATDPNGITAEAPETFYIYPNPSSGEFDILLPVEGAEITVTNAVGQQVLSMRATQKEVKLKLNENGMYVVAITTAKGTLTKKVVVSR